MQVNEYQDLAMRTNDGHSDDRLIDMLSGPADDFPAVGQMINAGLGLSGEVGEVNDAVKKYIFHRHPLERNNVIKELGDVCWYLALMADAIGIDLNTIMTENIEKLRRRYPAGFSEAASINRTE